MIAYGLSGNVWNAIYDAITRVLPPREITFGKVVKRDELKRLVWLEEFGDLAIPLVHFGSTFAYFDTDASGVAQLRQDTVGTNQFFQTKVMVPRIGQMAAIINPRGTKRFPMCVGVIQSIDYWQGET